MKYTGSSSNFVRKLDSSLAPSGQDLDIDASSASFQGVFAVEPNTGNRFLAEKEDIYDSITNKHIGWNINLKKYSGTVMLSSTSFSNSEDGYLADITIDTNSNVAVIASKSEQGNYDYGVFVFNSSNLSFKNSFSTGGNGYDEAKKAVIGADEKIYVTGGMDIYKLGIWDRDISTVEIDISTTQNKAPSLEWVFQENYWSDGLHPNVGVVSDAFTYRVKYLDPNNDAPSFVKVHIYKNGIEIQGSPFDMTFDGWAVSTDNYISGAFYEYTSTGMAPGNYTYQFEAYDNNTSSLPAVGYPVSSRHYGPHIGEGFIGNTSDINGATYSNGGWLEPKDITVYTESGAGDYVFALASQNGVPFVLKFSTGIDSVSASTTVSEGVGSGVKTITSDENGNVYFLLDQADNMVIYKLDKNFDTRISSALVKSLPGESGFLGLEYSDNALYSLSNEGVIECNPASSLHCSIAPFGTINSPLSSEAIDEISWEDIHYQGGKIYVIGTSTFGVVISTMQKNGSNYDAFVTSPFRPFSAGSVTAKSLAIDATGYIFAAIQANNGQNNNFMIAKFAPNFALVDTIMYDGGEMEELNSILIDTNTGNVYLTGKAEVKTSFYNKANKLIVLKYDNNLKFQSSYLFGSDSGEYNKGVSLALNSSGTPYVLGYVFGNYSSIRKIRAIKPVFPNITANLTVNIKDQSNNSLKDVNIALIPFTSGRPDLSFMDTSVTNSLGTASMKVVKGLSYLTAFSTPSYSPTVKDQIIDPYGNFVKVFNTDNPSVSYTLNSMAPKNTVYVNVNNIYKGAYVLAEVYLTKTQERVAYGILKSTDTSATVEIYNVPALSAGSYAIDISIPGWLSVTLSPQSAVPSTYTFTADMAQALPPSATYVQTTSTMSVYYSGFVGDSQGNAINAARVEVYYGCGISSCAFHQENYTDSNGKFVFSGLPFQPQNSLWSYIYKKGYVGKQIELTPLDIPALNMNYSLQTATYSISGIVKYMGSPVAYSRINIHRNPQYYDHGDSYAHKAASIGETEVYTDGDGYFSASGLTDGNIGISVEYPIWKDINSGNDKQWGTQDDIRITISSQTAIGPAYPSGNPCKGGKVWIIDSSGTCKGVMPYVFDVGVGISTSGVVYGDIVFSTTYTVTASEPLVISKSSAVVIGFFEECKNNCNNQKVFFKTIYGTLTKNTTSYSIDVSTQSKYWLDVLSNSWAKLNSYDDSVSFASTDSIRRDIILVPAGRLTGFIKNPDGSVYKPTEWPEIRIIGENISFERSANFDERTGKFEMSNIPGGKYRISARFANYPPVEVKNVIVNVGKTTNVDLQLQEGVFVSPQIYGLSKEIVRSTEVWHYKVLAVPSGQQMNQKYITDIFFKSPLYSFSYSSTTLQWSKLVMPEGQYDFYLALTAMYCTPDDDRCGYENYSQFAYFIGSLKNVSIKKDEKNPEIGTESQPILINILGTLGQNEFKGSCKGEKIFTDSDYDRVFANFDEVVNLIPAVMLYDTAGDLKAFSHVMPNKEGLQEFKEGILDKNKRKIQDMIADNKMLYYIWGLPSGKYTAIFANPNYPIVTKSVILPENSVYNFNFDQQNILVGSITGTVKSSSTLSLPLAGAMVYAKGKVVEKYLVTDSSGNFSLNNLPRGMYRLEVSMDGFVKTGMKVSINNGDTVKLPDFYLEPSTSAIKGRVFLSKFPNPLTKEGIKVSAYDETLNVTNSQSYLPVIEDLTDRDGNFELKGLVPGHDYKVSVIETGKMTSTATVTVKIGDNFMEDIVLMDLPPQIVVKLRKDPDYPRKVYVIIKSPKELVSIPECSYCEGGEYISTSAVNLALVPGANNTFIGKFTTSLNSRYYRIKVSVGDATKVEKEVTYDSVSNSKTEQYVYDTALIGGNVYMDPEREEYSGIELDPGALTQKSAETVDTSDFIGGFFKSLPNVRTTKTNKGDLTISEAIQNLMASEVYNIDLSNAQANKSFTITLKYDKEKAPNPDTLKLYQNVNGVWKEVPGSYSIDPMLGTVSVDVDSIEGAYEGSDGGQTPLSRKKHKMSALVNGKYVPSQSGSSQTGQFAVFTAKPDPNITYTGSSYKVYNFPNPFNIKNKTVTNLEGTGAFNGNTSYNTNGTIIKYHLPSGKDGHIKFVIYNTAGEKVRTLDEGTRAGGKTYYSEWNGKNDKNEDCASGVYFMVTYLNGEKLGNKLHKMAIIK